MMKQARKKNEKRDEIGEEDYLRRTKPHVLTKSFGANTLLAIPAQFNRNYTNDWMEKKEPKLLSISQMEHENNLSAPKYSEKYPVRKLKDYNTFLNALSYIEYDNLVIKEKLNQTKNKYQECSMKIDKRLVVNQ